MYTIRHTPSFKKSLRKLVSSGCFDVHKLKIIVETLSSGKNLNIKYRDHCLSGNMSSCRECHVKSDILLIYEIDKKQKILTLVEIGSHSELFD